MGRFLIYYNATRLLTINSNCNQETSVQKRGGNLYSQTTWVIFFLESMLIKLNYRKS
jgi:hypothetical protein